MVQSVPMNNTNKPFSIFYTINFLYNSAMNNLPSLSRIPGEYAIDIIDQTLLPHRYQRITIQSLEEIVSAINGMQVRGAPLIGIAAAYGMALAMLEECDDNAVHNAYAMLLATRPTAVNLRWALDKVITELLTIPPDERVGRAFVLADQMLADDIEACRQIGEQGITVINVVAKIKQSTINILTHCNAGSLAVVAWGTALAPIYLAHQQGVDVHVWVDETRPRNQGSSLTAWELQQRGVPYTVIADNVGGHLMQSNRVDMCMVGADRISRDGYVCNKIGTYLKALAARANNVPFYVAAPTSTIDWEMQGDRVTIEERDGDELRKVRGRNSVGEIIEVELFDSSSPVANYGFDVTPPHLVSAIITELGIASADEQGLAIQKSLLKDIR